MPGLWTAYRRSPLLAGMAGVLLLYLGVCCPVWSGAAESYAYVVYHPPHLSVKAVATNLPQVLRTIGKKLGFAVVDMGASRVPLTLFIEDATLEEVLRQLLRGENHAISYRGQEGRQAGGVMETIILLGPRVSPGAIPDHEYARLELKSDVDIRPHAGEAFGSWSMAPAHHELLPRSGEHGWIQDGGIAGEDGEVKVKDLLRVHALAGLWELAGDVTSATVSAEMNPFSEGTARPAVEGSPNATTIPMLSFEIDESLAITTRLAQQNLQALVDGLARATNSLLDSLAVQSR
jgi:hypothetical protein